ncbi:ankyrin [Apiospora marii]|uniref:ankyrin n=1 Tax=Apiospora marii TaxID=335849 RepID=UPI003130B05D
MPRLSSYKEPSDPRLVDKAYGYNPLFDILRANDVEALEEYLEEFPPSDDKVPGGVGDIFEEAIRFGSVDGYQKLVAYQKAQAAAGSDLLSPPYKPLWHACSYRQVDMVRHLLSTLDNAEAGISDTVYSGYTPLLCACSCLTNLDTDWLRRNQVTPATNLRYSEEIVDLLLDRGSSVQDRYYGRYHDDPPDGEEPELYETVLSLAITNAGPDLVRRLIDLGAPLQLPLRFPGEPTVRGATLMHIVATYANVEAIEILLGMPEGRVMLTTRDGEGRLPLHWASGCSHHDVFERPVYDEQTTASRVAATLKLLLPHSPVNAPDSLGNTPLHHAAQRLPGRLDTIRVLLEHGADPSLSNNADGDTPAHVAPRSQLYLNANHWTDMSQEIEKAFELFEKAANGGNAKLRDRPNNAGMTPRGLLNEERAKLEQRVAKRAERFARGRGGGSAQERH